MSEALNSALPMQAEAALMAARQGMQKPVQTADVERARKVSQDFEAFFLGQMLQPMFAEINAEEPFGGGPGEDIWKTMQIDEYGKAIARTGGIGIGDALFREILKMQEVN